MGNPSYGSRGRGWCTGRRWWRTCGSICWGLRGGGLRGLTPPARLKVTPREGAAGTRRVVEWWLRRWVLGRIEREDVRERMRGHRLVHPIRHGARVPRPRRDGDQRRLFEE